MSRYVIIGTGAVGGTIGGRLAQHDVPVVWVARGEHAEVLAADGMTLRTPDGTYRVTAPVWTGPADAELRAGDVLVLATKVHQAMPALTAWADLPVHSSDGEVLGTAGDHLPLITVTNGIAGEDLAIRYFRRVYGAAVWCPATHVRPGEIVPLYDSVSGVFWLGGYPGPAEPDELIRRIGADWETARLSAPVVDDVMAWKRRKLVLNMGNAVDALLEPGGPGPKRLLAAATAEAEAALAASGTSIVSVEQDEQERARGPQVAAVAGAPEQLGSSTFQSLLRGVGSVETDFLNGEIVRLGRLHGVPTPVNAALASLARRAASEGWAPRTMSAGQVDAEIERCAAYR